MTLAAEVVVMYHILLFTKKSAEEEKAKERQIALALPI